MMRTVLRAAKRRPITLGALGLTLVFALAACGGSVSATAKIQTPAAASAAADKTPAPIAAAGDRSLRRSVVRNAVRAGLGMYLQKVEFDDQPVKKDGHFHGFRIAALHDPAFWTGIDLRPGDVITKVNGMSIEHPEEALEAFHSLEVASELRITYERDGAPHELTYPIVEDEQPQKRADASAP